MCLPRNNIVTIIKRNNLHVCLSYLLSVTLLYFFPEMVLTNKTEDLEKSQNMTASKLEFELGKLSDRGMYYTFLHYDNTSQ